MGAAQSSLDGVGKEFDQMSDDAILRAAAAFLRQRPSLKESLFTRLSAPIEFEKPASQSAEEAAKADGVTVLYRSTWQKPHIHCRAGASRPWTQAPGIPLASSSIEGFPAAEGWFALFFPGVRELEFLVNDGGSQWDKAQGGGNHMAPRSGLWTLNRGALCAYSPGAVAGTGEAGDTPKAGAEPAASGKPVGVPCEEGGDPRDLAASKGGVVFLYRTPWPVAFLHFRLSEREPWTDPPGVRMAPSTFDGFPASGGWKALRIPNAQKLEFLPNNGGSGWDKAPGGANYNLSRPGAWQLMDGRASEVADQPVAPAAAPHAATGGASPAAGLEPPLTTSDMREVSASLAELLQLEGVVLLYRTNWPSPHLHCRETAGHNWTAMPGLRLSKAGAAVSAELESDTDGALFAAHLPGAESLEFVFNDGGPHFRWDKAAAGANFSIASAGVWLSFGGRLEQVRAPPPAPSGLCCSASTRSSVTLNWSPSVTGGVRGYRVFRDGKLVKSLAGGVTSFVDGGLFASRAYEYALAALSPQGAQGEKCEAITAKTGEAGAPGQPRNLRVASASGKGITLEWEAPGDTGGAPVTCYAITRNGKAAPMKVVGAEKSEKVTWTDVDVKHGSAYTYTVAACHLPPKGASRDSALKELAAEDRELLAQLKDDVNAGKVTEPVEAEAVDEMEVAACNPDLREQLKGRGITIFYKSNWRQVFTHACARPELGWTPPPGLPLTRSTTWAFPAEDGWFSIFFPFAKSMEFVVNDGGSQWDKAPGQQNYRAVMTGCLRLVGGHLERVSQPPQAPTGLQGEAIDGSRVRLTWKAPAVAEGEAPVSCYKIFRNGRQVTKTQGSNSCAFVDSNLFAFTDYEYSVVAVNNQDVSGPLSEATTVRTDVPGPPSAPRNVRATVKKLEGKLHVLLQWEPPADCGGAPVASYEVLRDGLVVHVFTVADAQLRGEAEELQPVAPEAIAGRRWLRHSSSYSSLSWFKDSLEWEDDDVVTGESYSYQVRAVQLGPERAEELKAGGVVQRCGSRFLENVLPDVVGPESDEIVVRATPFLDAPRLGEQRTIIMFQAFDWGSCKAPSWYTVLLGLLPELRSAGVNMLWLPPPSDSVDEHAYLPRKWYVLDNKYGSAEALQRLVTAMHEQEIWPMLDVVVNHRCASKQDSAGRWLKFEEPDWEGWAVCHNSPAVPGGTGAGVTGEPAQYAPSVDHTNPKVREDVNAYIHYMMNEIGFRALRFDFVKGYAPHFQRDYVKANGSPFAVAENWNGDVNGLHEYVNQCQGTMAVYDFPLYYVMKRCIHANNFEEMNCGGKLAGITGRDPARSCTFIDNHDTYQLAIVGGAFGNNEQVLRGYAVLLTHPGVPCVFHFDYVRSPQVREKLLQLCTIRRDAGIHSTSPLNICAATYGLYAAIIGGKVAVKIGTNDWSPGGGWKFACAGHEFAVWTKA